MVVSESVLLRRGTGGKTALKRFVSKLEKIHFHFVAATKESPGRIDLPFYLQVVPNCDKDGSSPDSGTNA